MQLTTWLLLVITTFALVAANTNSPEDLWDTDYDVAEDPIPNTPIWINNPEDLLDSQDEQRASSTKNTLYPRESSTREVRLLDGKWHFLKSSYDIPNEGVNWKWYEKGITKLGRKTLLMPVPASYNDITNDKNLRDHLGDVWYERYFFVPRAWEANRTVWLRFSSIVYFANVWINGKSTSELGPGNYPYSLDITKLLDYKKENRITVKCSNRLEFHTVPPGFYTNTNGKNVSRYYFDYFHYAGIHGSVHLYTTPTDFITDIKLSTKVLKNKEGTIDFDVQITNLKSPLVELRLYDKAGNIVARQDKKPVTKGQLVVKNVKPWWPYLMNGNPGYMYALEFVVYNKNTLIDEYRLPIGIRSLRWNKEGLFINDKRVYLQGVNKHEDSEVRGRGFDLAVLESDINLMKWLGVNVYRTTHYPHSEESIQLADEHGIMIIDECASINLNNFKDYYLKKHKESMSRLIQRDRNHPSVIAWSFGNEPLSKNKLSEKYFSELRNHSLEFDKSRPFTAGTRLIFQDYMAKSLDIIGLVRYNGWYKNNEKKSDVTSRVIEEVNVLYKQAKKPIILMGYGAQAIQGYHEFPPFMWSESYQYSLLESHFRAFAELRKQKWLLGELVTSFADFKTKDTIEYVGYDRMGIFTRKREPKKAARLLKTYYTKLGQSLYNITVPW